MTHKEIICIAETCKNHDGQKGCKLPGKIDLIINENGKCRDYTNKEVNP